MLPLDDAVLSSIKDDVERRPRRIIPMAWVSFSAQSEMSIYRTLVAIKLNSHGWSDPLTTTTNKAVIEGIGNVVVTRDSASPDS